jgi:hypothetical protein
LLEGAAVSALGIGVAYATAWVVGDQETMDTIEDIPGDLKEQAEGVANYWDNYWNNEVQNFFDRVGERTRGAWSDLQSDVRDRWEAFKDRFSGPRAQVGGSNTQAYPPPPYVIDINSDAFQGEIGEYVGSGHCAALAQSNMNMPLTKDWKRGESVLDNKSLPPGTVLANFQGPGGTYSQVPPYSHTVVLIGYQPNGIMVYDQWIVGPNPQKVTARLLKYGGVGSANNADLFHAVR